MLVYRVRVKGKRRRFQIINRGIAAAPEIVADELLTAIRGPQSRWPVLTGLSKNSFYTDIDGNIVRLENLTDYAHVVEERQGKARETWLDVVDKDEVRQRIVEEANGRR